MVSGSLTAVQLPRGGVEREESMGKERIYGSFYSLEISVLSQTRKIWEVFLLLHLPGLGCLHLQILSTLLSTGRGSAEPHQNVLPATQLSGAAVRTPPEYAKVPHPLPSNASLISLQVQEAIFQILVL